MKDGSPHARARSRRWVGIALLGWIAAASAPAQEEAGAPTRDVPDVPVGPATLQGEVVHPEATGEVGPVEVLLYALPSGGEPGVRHGRTDAQGRFRFEGISNDPNDVYLVGARYRGVPFPGARVQFREGELVRSTSIRIGELTEDPAALRLREIRMHIDWDGHALAITEALQVENGGDRTAYVPEPRRNAETALLTVALPDGIETFGSAFGLPLEGVVRDGNVVRLYGPFYPSTWGGPFSGDQGPRLRYTIPAQVGAVALERPASKAIERLVASAGPGVASLQVAGAEVREAEGTTEFVLEGTPLRGATEMQLELHATRGDPAALRNREARIFLELDGTALSVREEYRFAVLGDAPLVAADGTALYTIELPPRARELRFDPAALDLGLAAAGNGRLELTGPVPAGESTFSLAYQVPAQDDTTLYVKRFDRALPLLAVFVADTGLEIRTDRLHRRRPARAGTRVYSYWEAFQIGADEEVSIELQPLRRGAALGPWGVRGLIALAAAGVAWTLLAPLGGMIPRRRGSVAAGMAATDPRRAEREAIYVALRDLEHDYETGKVSKTDYAAMRAELRQRVASLIRAGTAKPDPEVATRPTGCSQCGAEPRSGDRFCSQCGQPLPGTSATA